MSFRLPPRDFTAADRFHIFDGPATGHARRLFIFFRQCCPADVPAAENAAALLPEGAPQQQQQQQQQDTSSSHVVSSAFSCLYVAGAPATEAASLSAGIPDDHGASSNIARYDEDGYCLILQFFPRRFRDRSAIKQFTASRGLVGVCEANAILGFVRFLHDYHLFIVTSAEEVAQLGPHSVYGVRGTKLLLLNDEGRYQESMSSRMMVGNRIEDLWSEEYELKDAFLGVRPSAFFYSPSLDLSRTMQSLCLSAPDSVTIGGAARMASDSAQKPDPSVLPRRKFMWNTWLCEKYERNLPALKQQCILTRIIHGDIMQRRIRVSPASSFQFTVITRRSRHFAGVRYLKRGLTEEGRAANHVETEQIVIDEAGCDVRDVRSLSSFCQVRCSVPVHWHHESNVTAPKPPIFFGPNDANFSATRNHFAELIEDYGTPVLICNLMQQNERKVREEPLSDVFFKAVETIVKQEHSSGSGSLNIICYHDYDFRQNVRTAWNMMTAYAERSLGETRCFVLRRGVVEAVQRGVVRTNCVDCIDRTNVAQCFIAAHVLEMQLVFMCAVARPVAAVTTQLRTMLLDMFQVLGDTIAQDYCGSETVSAGIETGRGILWDKVMGVKRFYANKFSDDERQLSMNFFNGLYRMRSRPALNTAPCSCRGGGGADDVVLMGVDRYYDCADRHVRCYACAPRQMQRIEDASSVWSSVVGFFSKRSSSDSGAAADDAKNSASKKRTPEAIAAMLASPYAASALVRPAKLETIGAMDYYLHIRRYRHPPSEDVQKITPKSWIALPEKQQQEQQHNLSVDWWELALSRFFVANPLPQYHTAFAEWRCNTSDADLIQLQGDSAAHRRMRRKIEADNSSRNNNNNTINTTNSSFSVSSSAAGGGSKSNLLMTNNYDDDDNGQVINNDQEQRSLPGAPTATSKLIIAAQGGSKYIVPPPAIVSRGAHNSAVLAGQQQQQQQGAQQLSDNISFWFEEDEISAGELVPHNESAQDAASAAVARGATATDDNGATRSGRGGSGVPVPAVAGWAPRPLHRISEVVLDDGQQLTEVCRGLIVAEESCLRAAPEPHTTPMFRQLPQGAEDEIISDDRPTFYHANNRRQQQQIRQSTRGAAAASGGAGAVGGGGGAAGNTSVWAPLQRITTLTRDPCLAVTDLAGYLHKLDMSPAFANERYWQDTNRVLTEWSVPGGSCNSAAAGTSTSASSGAAAVGGGGGGAASIGGAAAPASFVSTSRTRRNERRQRFNHHEESLTSAQHPYQRSSSSSSGKGSRSSASPSGAAAAASGAAADSGVHFLATVSHLGPLAELNCRRMLTSFVQWGHSDTPHGSTHLAQATIDFVCRLAEEFTAGRLLSQLLSIVVSSSTGAVARHKLSAVSNSAASLPRCLLQLSDRELRTLKRWATLIERIPEPLSCDAAFAMQHSLMRQPWQESPQVRSFYEQVANGAPPLYNSSSSHHFQAESEFQAPTLADSSSAGVFVVPPRRRVTSSSVCFEQQAYWSGGGGGTGGAFDDEATTMMGMSGSVASPGTTNSGKLRRAGSAKGSFRTLHRAGGGAPDGRSSSAAPLVLSDPDDQQEAKGGHVAQAAATASRQRRAAEASGCITTDQLWIDEPCPIRSHPLSFFMHREPCSTAEFQATVRSWQSAAAAPPDKGGVPRSHHTRYEANLERKKAERVPGGTVVACTFSLHELVLWILSSSQSSSLFCLARGFPARSITADLEQHWVGRKRRQQRSVRHRAAQELAALLIHYNLVVPAFANEAHELSSAVSTQRLVADQQRLFTLEVFDQAMRREELAFSSTGDEDVAFRSALKTKEEELQDEADLQLRIEHALALSEINLRGENGSRAAFASSRIFNDNNNNNNKPFLEMLSAADQMTKEMTAVAENHPHISAPVWSFTSATKYLSHDSRNRIDDMFRLHQASLEFLDPVARNCVLVNVFNVLFAVVTSRLTVSMKSWEALRMLRRHGFRFGGVYFSLADIKHGLIRHNRPQPGFLLPQFADNDTRLSLLSSSHCSASARRIEFDARWVLLLADITVVHHLSPEDEAEASLAMQHQQQLLHQKEEAQLLEEADDEADTSFGYALGEASVTSSTIAAAPAHAAAANTKQQAQGLGNILKSLWNERLAYSGASGDESGSGAGADDIIQCVPVHVDNVHLLLRAQTERVYQILSRNYPDALNEEKDDQPSRLGRNSSFSATGPLMINANHNHNNRDNKSKNSSGGTGKEATLHGGAGAAAAAASAGAAAAAADAGDKSGPSAEAMRIMSHLVALPEFSGPADQDQQQRHRNVLRTLENLVLKHARAGSTLAAKIQQRREKERAQGGRAAGNMRSSNYLGAGGAGAGNNPFSAKRLGAIR